MQRRSFVAGVLAAELQAQGSDLPARVEELLARAPGQVSFLAKNLDTGATFGVKPDEPVRTASTIKLPIMAAVFGEVAAGRLKFSDTVTLSKRDKVSGSGILRELSEGLQIPIRDLVHLMIVVSDNTATNLVLDRITADVVNRYTAKLGLTQTFAMRKVLGDPNTPAGLSEAGKLEKNKRYGLGVSSPRDMVKLLEMLQRGEVVSPEASKEMIAILRRQQIQDGIARKLGDTKVASKSGALDALRSDVGIVYSPGGRIAIAVTVDGMKKPDWSPENPGDVFIGELAKLLVEGLSK